MGLVRATTVSLVKNITAEQDPVRLARLAFERNLLVVAIHPMHAEMYTKSKIINSLSEGATAVVKIRGRKSALTPQNLDRIKGFEGELTVSTYNFYAVQEGNIQLFLAPPPYQFIDQNSYSADPKLFAEQYLRWRRPAISFLRECGNRSVTILILSGYPEQLDSLLVRESVPLGPSVFSYFGEIREQRAMKELIDASEGVMMIGAYRLRCLQVTKNEIGSRQSTWYFKRVPIYDVDALIL